MMASMVQMAGWDMDGDHDNDDGHDGINDEKLISPHDGDDAADDDDDDDEDDADVDVDDDDDDDDDDADHDGDGDDDDDDDGGDGA